MTNSDTKQPIPVCSLENFRSNPGTGEPESAKSSLIELFSSTWTLSEHPQDEEIDGTKRSEYISLVGAKMLERPKALSTISSFLVYQPPSSTRNTFYTERESIRSVIPDQRVINMNSDELRPELLTTKIRNNFMQKVYGILACQVVVMLLLLALGYFVEPIHLYFEANGEIIGTPFLVNYFFLGIILILCVRLRRQFPGNLILMILMTISLSVAISAFALVRNAVSPYYCASIALILTLTMTLASKQSKWDITSNMTCFWVAVYTTATTTTVIGIMMYVGHQRGIVLVIIGSVKILCFTLWIIHVTRRLAVGKTEKTTVEDYIFAALTLYVEILLIFVFIIEAIKYCRRL